MNKLLKIIFSQFYKWGCQYNFANSPHLSAMYMLSLLLTINVLFLSGLYEFFFNSNFIGLEDSKTGLLLVLGFITSLIYFHFIKDEKYKKNYTEFLKKTEREKRKYAYVAISYVLLSVILVFVGVFLLGLRKKGLL